MSSEDDSDHRKNILFYRLSFNDDNLLSYFLISQGVLRRSD